MSCSVAICSPCSKFAADLVMVIDYLKILVMVIDYLLRGLTCLQKPLLAPVTLLAPREPPKWPGHISDMRYQISDIRYQPKWPGQISPFNSIDHKP